jgi:hypothetical protein
MININEYKKQLFEISGLFAPTVEEVLIVPSIKEWCLAKGITESSEDRAGKCLLNHSTGRHLILISEVITEDEKESIIGAMSFHGSAEEDCHFSGAFPTSFSGPFPRCSSLSWIF